MTNNVRRRGFLATIFGLFAARLSAAQPGPVPGAGRLVRSGKDRFDKTLIIAKISRLFVKVSSEDTDGRLFILEHHHTQKGGPSRHLHYEQDEWFYVLEGSYIAEVGSERYDLGPGDSLFAPRKIPHAFAHVGEGVGRLLIVFQPAGKMEAHFNALAGQEGFTSDPSRLPDFGMERVGPPLEF